MLVTKHGDMVPDNDIIHFECSKCGCEYEAMKNEYYCTWETSSADDITHVNTNTYTRTKYLVSSCPECHKIVRTAQIFNDDEIDKAFLGSQSITTKVNSHMTPDPLDPLISRHVSLC